MWPNRAHDAWPFTTPALVRLGRPAVAERVFDGEIDEAREYQEYRRVRPAAWSDLQHRAGRGGVRRLGPGPAR